MFSASCSECDAEQRKAKGCNGSDCVVWSDPITEDEYYACPVKFIPDNCYQFIAEYQYIKDHPHTAKSYREIGAKFLEGEKEYEYHFKQFNVLANGGTIERV